MQLNVSDVVGEEDVTERDCVDEQKMMRGTHLISGADFGAR